MNQPSISYESALVLTGEFDVNRTDEVREEILERMTLGAPVIVDVAGVTFIDSGGLRGLLEAREALDRHGIGLFLVNLPRNVRRLLEITGTLELFAVSADDT